PVFMRLGEQRLEDAHAPAAKPLCASGHVEAPDSICPLACRRRRRRGVALEARDPGAQGARVVLAEVLDIANFESGALGSEEALGDRNEFAVWKDVTVQEARCAIPSARRLLIGDPVVEKEPSRT